MPPLHTQSINHEINKPLVHIQVIGNYYHVINNGCKHNLDETNTSIVIYSLNLHALFCESTFTSNFLIASLNIHTRGNRYFSLVYIMYTNALNDTPYYTHDSL